MSGWVADPDATLRWAAEVLRSRRAGVESRARAWHAAAVAHMERCAPTLARRAARRGLALAASPELQLVLAWIEQDRGNPRESRRLLNLAQPRLRGAPLARARCLRGLQHCVAGQYREAHRQLSIAITGSRRHGDRHWLANALNGRGVVRIYLGRLPAADRDLAAASALYRELGQTERAATCVHNRGCVALQADDHPRALRLFDEAVRAGLRTGARAEALIDRAHALLGAGLLAEAGKVLVQAADLLDGTGRRMRLAEASLALAHCAARAGRREIALDAARRARDLFRAQRRPGWLAAAESVELRLTGGPGAEAVARRCVRHGFAVEAAELRLAAGDRTSLNLVQANRSSGPTRLRALGWLAGARLAALDGDRRALLAACRAGLRIGVADLADEFTAIAVPAALDSGRAWDVLRWIARVPPTGVIERLGSQAMVCYARHGDQWLAVSVVDGQARLHRLRGGVDVETLRFAVAHGEAPTMARRHDDILLAPLRPVIGDRALVVVPTTELHGLPWAALPTCAARPVSVAPSVPAWLHASQHDSTVDNPVWVAGPNLRHAVREVRALHRRWGGTLLTGRRATVAAALSTMDGAELVHIAAHGRFRGDAPSFSHLELADGPLHAYDLAGLSRPPRVLVLSACEGALSALPGHGTRAVIASTLPVPDDAAVELVTALHSHLRAGAAPAEALARAQAEHGHLGFVCIGAG
ncbi:MAG TPA: CHAT domain-containing protein [Actinophytocola sp.]|uniref:CHAT domain-containing protein n=1 Tax=Actinophytocola sp. TaxID=1872138 RepID=UPI002DDDBB1D|nr:CHAT domain-containing protein [Actinophytocola sp.]HEV2783060.1 CHAT domain-containing protein [Actinophytocola sp.]